MNWLKKLLGFKVEESNTHPLDGSIRAQESRAVDPTPAPVEPPAPVAEPAPAPVAVEQPVVEKPKRGRKPKAEKAVEEKPVAVKKEKKVKAVEKTEWPFPTEGRPSEKPAKIKTKKNSK